MRRLLLGLALTAALLALANVAFGASRTCGTISPSPATLAEVQQRIGSLLGPNGAQCGGGTIMVAVHVIQAGASGFIAPSRVDAQIAELNANFAPWGYTFVLSALDYTNNAVWYNNNDPAVEIAMTTALSIDPAHTLNIYTGILYGGAYLGYAYYPDAFPESDMRHGVYLDFRTFPGFGFVPYHLGRTATHEIGHYLGLYHTFEGGCSPPDDYVADTPEEFEPNVGCPIGMDSCPADPGLDPIHNYMDYTDDVCYTEFSFGQADRMCAIVATYRPSLLGGGPTLVLRGSWGSVKVRYR
jgi:hypothetical protein